MDGAFYPLDSFMNEADYYAVLTKMKLAGGSIWPIPVVLDLGSINNFRTGDEILLCDEYGKPLAVMEISSVFTPDKNLEAKKIYKTVSKNHPGVNYLFYQTGKYYLGGKIIALDRVDHYDFTEYRLTPEELKDWFSKNSWKNVIGFQTRNPLHKAHYYLIKNAAVQYKSKVLIHPVVGLTKEGDIDYLTRVRCYIKMYKNHLSRISKLALIPLAMRMAGPREALWHAIIRKNYGCTHFIVGRDHAGPSKINGESFYGSYEAQNLVKQYEKEIGIKMVPFEELVYVEEDRKFIPIGQVSQNKTVRRISGSEIRRKIANNEEIPDWFSYREIIEEIRKGLEKDKRDGLTIFFTGLPCAGKSTIARILYYKLLELQDKKVVLLDGDVIRQNLSKGLGFSKEDRNENIKRLGFVANMITKMGGIAICSAVAPYQEARQVNRTLINKSGKYIQVYVSTPVSVCRKRDIKGLYRKAKLGLLKGLTGVDDPYEFPENSEIVIDTVKSNPLENSQIIIKYLKKNRYISVRK